jgi:hypothetical protein
MATEDLPDERTPGAQGEDAAALERALLEVPRGALALSGIAVALLLVGWFLLYFAVFLPRGSVG